MATNRNQQEIKELIDAWGIPFARALGEFARSIATNAPEVSSNANNSTGAGGFKILESTPSDDSDAEPIEFAAFNPRAPAKKAVNRLKRHLKERGIKQVDLARRLGVAPSVISRVLKHPERSRLQTIRNIAQAANIPLGELV